MAHYLRQEAYLVRPRPPPRGESHPGNHLLTVTQLPGCFPMLRRRLRRGGHHVIDITLLNHTPLREPSIPTFSSPSFRLCLYSIKSCPLDLYSLLRDGSVTFFPTYFISLPSGLNHPTSQYLHVRLGQRMHEAGVGAPVRPPVHMTTSNFAVYFFWE